MYCENSGYWGATFDLVITLDNAHISLKTSPPYTLVNDQTAKFSFTLGPGERQSRQAWYIIDQNVSDFYLDLTFQTSSSGFIKSDPGGVTQVSYQKVPQIQTSLSASSAHLCHLNSLYALFKCLFSFDLIVLFSIRLPECCFLVQDSDERRILENK